MEPLLDGANDTRPPAPANPHAVPDDTFKLKFCTVCASNQNRYVMPYPTPSFHIEPC